MYKSFEKNERLSYLHRIYIEMRKMAVTMVRAFDFKIEYLNVNRIIN